VYLIARIILLIVYAATLSGFFYAVGLLILLALAALVSIIQPYREDLAVHSNIDIVLITIMAIHTVYIHFTVSLAVSFIIIVQIEQSICEMVSLTKLLAYNVVTM